MKKFVIAASLLCTMISFTSCLKDHCQRSYTYLLPIYKKLSDLRSEVGSRAATSIQTTGKIYLKDYWIFLNEQGKGIHVIDNTDPAHPVVKQFLNIPGNIDMAIKGNILYADLYCDLAAIDISDPAHIKVEKYLGNVFPERSSHPFLTNTDSIDIVVGWRSVDTSVACGWQPASCVNCYYDASSPSLLSSSPSSSASSPTSANGIAGSTARFAAVNDYMYTVSLSTLSVINITEAANPLFIQKKSIGSSIETIFPYGNKLFVGASGNMSVYDLSNPTDPQQSSWNGHWCGHDPVVADDKFAYVTLHEADICGSKINELEIFDLRAGATSPTKTYAMKKPTGLSIDGQLLFLCDDGLKIYDVSDIQNIKLLKQFSGIATSDVIAANGIAYVVAAEGMYQYDYHNTSHIYQLSKLSK